MSTKKKIYFHGYLKDLLGESLEVEATSIAEAVRSLQFLPGFAPEGGGLRSITIDEVESEIDLYGTDIVDEINIRPLMGGAGGRDGLMQIVIGVALIAVGVLLGPAGTLVGQFITGSSLVMAGAMMALGGLLQMLAPTPEVDDDESESRYLGSDQNTVRIGTRIPLLFGAGKIPGHYLSYNTDAKKIKQETEGTKIVPDLDTLEQDIVEGKGDYADGRFAYTINRASFSLPGQDRPNAVNLSYLNAGEGRTDTLEPDVLFHEVFGRQNSRGVRAVYKTQFVVPSTGDYEFRLANEASGAGVKIYNLTTASDVDPVAAVYSLTAGDVYRITVTIERDEFQVQVLYSPEGDLEFKQGAGAWELFGPTSLSSTSIEEEDFGGREVEEALYFVHDEPVLVDDLTPVQPVFASQTRGPTNIPTSGWSI